MAVARPLQRLLRTVSCANSLQTSSLTPTTIKRTLRMTSVDTNDINMIPESVAFNGIDKKGRTRRFYRQVFVQPVMTSNSSSNENDEDIKSSSGWAIYLDSRVLMTGGNPIILDSYKLALVIASELEAQSEFMRTESMPILDTVVSYLDNVLGRAQGKFNEDMQRRGYRGSVNSNFENDLLKICENEELYKTGFYTSKWQPILDWFNEEFESQVEMRQLFMQGEEAPMSEYDKLGDDLSGMMELNAANLMDNFKKTEMGKMIDFFETEVKQNEKDEVFKAKKELNAKKMNKFLNNLDTGRLWMIDEMTGYIYSPIMAIALVCNAFSLDHILSCINCPELDTQMYDENTDSLKLNETKLKLAAARVFLDCYDELVPFDNSVIKRRDVPIM